MWRNDYEVFYSFCHVSHYVDIVFVLLVFMVPAEMVYRWTSGRKPSGYVSCLSDFLGYPDGYRYTLSDFFRDMKQGWRNFK